MEKYIYPCLVKGFINKILKKFSIEYNIQKIKIKKQ